MEIPQNTLMNVVGRSEMHRAGMHKDNLFHAKITRFYCQPLTSSGYCSGICNLCALSVKEEVDKIDQKEARSPYAVLVWRLRNAVARMQEAASQDRPPSVKRDLFGDAQAQDGLSEFEEMLGT